MRYSGDGNRHETLQVTLALHLLYERLRHRARSSRQLAPDTKPITGSPGTALSPELCKTQCQWVNRSECIHSAKKRRDSEWR